MNEKNIAPQSQIPYFKQLIHLHKTIDISVIKHFFTYAFGAIALRGITIFLTPLNMRKLHPSDYGMLALVNGFISIATAIVGLGLRQVLSIEYFHCDQVNRKRLINEIIILYVSIALPVLIASLYVQNTIAQHIFLGKVSPTLVAPILFITFLYFFVELLYQVLQYERKAAPLTLLQTTIALITVFCTVFFIWHLNSGASGIVWAQLLGMVCASTTGIVAYTKNNYQHYAPVSKNMHMHVKNGLPFIPTVLFGWLLACGDRWILAQYASMHTVGIYAIADMFGQLFYFLVLYPWSGSYLPYILNQFTQNKNNLLATEKINKRIMYWCMLGAAILITVGCLTGKSFLHFMLPPVYHEALNYIWIILMGQVFLLGSYFATCLIQFHKKTYFLAFALCIPAALNIVLNIMLIPLFSLYGCTLATLLSYGVYFGITLWYNHHLQKQMTQNT